MESHKPVILIGYFGVRKHLVENADEVAWGIEEEGCLSERYIMSDGDDLKYSLSDVTVVLKEEGGFLYVNELSKNLCLLSVPDHSKYAYRQLGKNAAKYLKKTKLCL